SWADAGYNAGTDATCENGGTADSAALTLAELGPLASNGGPTQTVLPLAGNPALGIVPASTSVTLDGSPVALCPVTDQRGVASAPGAACDAGAVQVPAASAGRPAVTRVTPGAGPDAGGTFVTITGTNFTPGAKVELGQGSGPGPGAIMATGVNVVSATKITATTGGPARPGNWHVFVITPGGTSKASAGNLYHYDAPPVVTSLSPAHGPAGGGTRVTIHGSDFKPGASVLFGAVAGGHVSYVSARELTVTAPPGSGTVTVTVTTPGGTSAPTSHDQYHYT
ncbi:MAG: IPT/TIG domain-containing protein, partial [Streptosporangiaceae bacterium]